MGEAKQMDFSPSLNQNILIPTQTTCPNDTLLQGGVEVPIQRFKMILNISRCTSLFTNEATFCNFFIRTQSKQKVSYSYFFSPRPAHGPRPRPTRLARVASLFALSSPIKAMHDGILRPVCMLSAPCGPQRGSDTRTMI